MINEWSQKLDNHTSFKQKMGKSVIFYDQLIEKELVTQIVVFDHSLVKWLIL